MPHPRSAVLRRRDEGLLTHWDDDRGQLSFRTMIGDGGTDTEQLTSGVCTVPAGGFLAEHAHEAVEVYAVLRGAAEVTAGEQRMRMTAGDLLSIPSGLRHGLRNHGDEPFEFLFTYAADSLDDPRTRYSA